MNTKTLKTLEYYKIIDELKNYAYSTGGKELCEGLFPFTDLTVIRKAQTETSDALSRLLQNGSISFTGLKDVRPSLLRADINSSLSPVELLNISRLLDIATKIKQYSRKQSSNNNDAIEFFKDSLSERFDIVEPLTPLNTEIKRCIISEEEISDDASPKLKDIRRHIKLANDRIHTELNSIINSQAVRSCLQDNLITMRNGRYCIPVKAEHRSSVQGMIHDQSKAGSTLFIEPLAIVKLNNEIRELELSEAKEIEVILAKLTAEVSDYTTVIKDNYEILTELDFIFAKAHLSKNHKCSEPIFNTDGIIDIKKARHPLIPAKNVVPTDIRLGKDFDLLVITGPNTGGKTVCLKTTGLLTLMGQAGLHIPAFDNSQLAVFNNVFADIGDEQSIEQSLSTFSSHMTNIVKILNEVDNRSLVLFDELGAGTDPIEGAALATSVLDYLHKKGIRTMATTHYSELKVYALSTEGVSNACCEFDVETLRPTYRLLIGIPGKSNAFAISQKLGLPMHIIDASKELISAKDKDFEDLLADLEESRITIEKEQEQISRYKQEIEILKEKLEAKHTRLDEKQAAILEKAREEAFNIVKEAKDLADSTIRNINKAGLAVKDLENERTKLRKGMDALQSKKVVAKATAKKEYTAADFKLGTAVKILSLNMEGSVCSLPNAKGDLYVQMGILRSQVNIKDLDIIPDKDDPSTTDKAGNIGKIKVSKSMSVSTELNLIGMTTDEALVHLEKYLDDAYLSHLPQARIVHGKGTGALRNIVHQTLKRSKYVKSYRLGVYGEGENGVTIVEFK
ncbi:MAG: endonuclease MutS2 [Lachnospiraceae bacterium]|nr:endonuclease MutS2 [Lachnospiraceae bacterium]